MRSFQFGAKSLSKHHNKHEGGSLRASFEIPKIPKIPEVNHHNFGIAKNLFQKIDFNKSNKQGGRIKYANLII